MAQLTLVTTLIFSVFMVTTLIFSVFGTSNNFYGTIKFKENCMVKLFNWLFWWSYLTSNNNATRVMCVDCYMVYTVYLPNMFHRGSVLLDLLNHQIKHLTSVILLLFTLYYFICPFVFLLLDLSNTSIPIYLFIYLFPYIFL